MSSNYLKGFLAECIANNYVKKLGYKILDKNFSFGKYEIDIIAADKKCLVFLEVRGRSIASLCSGYFSVNKKKKSNISIAAKAYLQSLKKQPLTVRFDIVEITWLENLNLNPFLKNKYILKLLAPLMRKYCQIAHFENVRIN